MNTIEPITKEEREVLLERESDIPERFTRPGEAALPYAEPIIAAYEAALTAAEKRIETLEEALAEIECRFDAKARAIDLNNDEQCALRRARTVL